MKCREWILFNLLTIYLVVIAEAIKCLHCIYLARSEVPAKKQGRKFNFCKRLSNTGILSFLSLCFTRRRNLTVFFCLFLLWYVFESYCLHQTSKILFATSRPVTGYTPAKNRRRKSRMKKVKNQLASYFSPLNIFLSEKCAILCFSFHQALWISPCKHSRFSSHDV